MKVGRGTARGWSKTSRWNVVLGGRLREIERVGKRVSAGNLGPRRYSGVWISDIRLSWHSYREIWAKVKAHVPFFHLNTFSSKLFEPNNS